MLSVSFTIAVSAVNEVNDSGESVAGFSSKVMLFVNSGENEQLMHGNINGMYKSIKMSILFCFIVIGVNCFLSVF